MTSRFCFVCAILLALLVVGCGSVTKSIVGKQEWSENYSLVEGVEATSPLMVDGDMSTVGETQRPTGASSSNVYSEAIVKLPEAKNIRRVVIHTTNIEDYSVYAGAGTEDTWKLLTENKKNEEKTIDLSVSANTDRIRVRVRSTSDDSLRPGRVTRNRVQHAMGKIKELELYGLVTETVPEAPQAAMASGTTGEPGVPGTPGAPTQAAAQVPEAPAPPAVLTLESPQNTYALAGPIPLKINLKIGPNDLVVLEDYMAKERLCTKLTVKPSEGSKIACAKTAPPLSAPRPYRGSGKEVNVRNGKTLDAGSVVTVDIPNLLDYYPISGPGTYTVQFDLGLAVHKEFVGRNQTQIDDLERTISDVNSRSNYSATEKAAIIQGLREDIEQLKQKKENRYIVVGSPSETLNISSNTLELVIQ